MSESRSALRVRGILQRLKHLNRFGMRKAEIYGTVALGISIFLFIVIRLIVG
jgi:hypothetical protein